MVRRLLPVLVLPAALAALAGPAAGQADGGAGDPAASEEASMGSLAGRVVSSLNGGPLAGALVVARDGEGRQHDAVTGPDGRYRLPRVAAGRWTLRVSTLDHQTFRGAVRVPPGESVELDVVLALRPVVLPALSAVTDPVALVPSGGEDTEPGEEVRGTQGDPELRALDAGPGAGGVVRAMEGTRGGPPRSPSSVLYVRGGAADLKRVLLDGAPVYAPFHLGGLMDAVPDGVFRSARLYTGGAPLAYDGGLSYVLDLRTRRGGETSLSTGGHLDVLGGALRADGSAGDVSWLASGRTTHGAASDRLLDGDLPYGYEELLGRVDLDVAPGHHLALTGFTNRESVRLAGSAAPRDRASWGNEAASLRYGAALGGTRALLTAAATRFDTRLPVSASADELGRSETERIRLALDVTTRIGGVELSYGTAYNRHRTDVSLPPAGYAAPGVRWLGEASTGAAYGAATVRPWENLDVRGGLRVVADHGEGSPHVVPRAAVTWRASDVTDVRVSAGRFHQLLESPESALSSDLDEWSEILRRQAAAGTLESPSSISYLGSASASHVTVRMDHRIRDELELGLEGYFKAFSGLAEAGRLHASGADLWLDFRSDAWAGWVGYSLAWTWSETPSAGPDATFSGRQLLSAGLEAPLPTGMRLAARVRASSGLPFNRIPLTGGGAGVESPAGAQTLAWEAENSGAYRRDPVLSGPPDGSYLRFDLTLSRSFRTGLWGREVALRPYLRFLNALDRRDALFYQFDPASEMRPRALDSLPVLPVIGVAWDVP